MPRLASPAPAGGHGSFARRSANSVRSRLSSPALAFATMPWDYRQVWSRGSWVSAHPDVILKMGVKQVLHRTRHLGWGTDTHLYRTAEARRDEFPSRLQSTQPRVPKQNRGNGGQGVWKVEAPSEHADKGN